MIEEGMGGGFKITPKVKGKLNPIKNRVIVSDMHFGEQVRKSGLILTGDDGTSRGIYPRWCKVHAKGPENDDEYSVGDWILVEHGRWTRGIDVDEGNGESTLRMVEAESIIGYSKEQPTDAQMAAEV
tara:strand:- start:8775 stop:9155 length:381 start_codon:yes stop_codon:yes gene_type:complete